MKNYTVSKCGTLLESNEQQIDLSQACLLLNEFQKALDTKNMILDFIESDHAEIQTEKDNQITDLKGQIERKDQKIERKNESINELKHRIFEITVCNGKNRFCSFAQEHKAQAKNINSLTAKVVNLEARCEKYKSTLTLIKEL